MRLTTWACYLLRVGKKKKDLWPKSKCCESKDKCRRCPLRMLKEGTMPEGWTVKRRRLVKVD